MKKLVVFLLVVFSGILQAQDQKKNEISLALGYMFEGEMYMWETDRYYSVGETFLVRGEFTHYFGKMFGLGGYLGFGMPFYSGIYEEVAMAEIGLLFKIRFAISDKLQLKPGLYTGFRGYGGDAGIGLGLNGNVALQYQVTERFKPFFEIGILSQPAGGNEASDITYSPTFQASIGITF